jgi:hypothetical protein
VARLALDYARALLRVAPPRDLLRAALRRFRFEEKAASPRPTEVTRAAEALSRMPRLLSPDDPLPLYQERFPEAIERFRRRALRILDGEAEIFGEWRRPGAPDPKVAWEFGRAGHLVELAAAARLHRELRDPALGRMAKEIARFQDLPQLDSSIRVIHWLVAFELLGGVPPRLRGWLARSLLEEGAFLETHLEDSGVCPANHLMGDWLGLLVIGIALESARFVTLATAGLRREAERQVTDDGAHFEASTAYHRFAFELLWIADRLVGGFEPTLRKMADYTRQILAPDGSEPGFGDGDDARLVPIVPRPARDHSYLPALMGFRRPGPPPEELIWWRGKRGLTDWEATAPASDPPCASFAKGGVHILRSRRLQVALRAGSHGQHGVGGHAHNDQLSIVVHADGKPLLVDPGTGSYTHDPVARDRFRGVSAHSSLSVAGEEPSPLFADRPFALPDRAQTGEVAVEDLGELASLMAAHHGYERLPARVRHQRRLTLYRELDALLVEDDVDGRGAIAVEVRFQLAESARLGASAAVRARVLALGGRLGPLDLARAVCIGERAALVPLAGNPLSISLQMGWSAPRFGSIDEAGVVSVKGLLSLPHTVAVTVLLLR